MSNGAPNFGLTVLGFVLGCVVLGYLISEFPTPESEAVGALFRDNDARSEVAVFSEHERHLLNLAESKRENDRVAWTWEAAAFNLKPEAEEPEAEEIEEPPSPPPPPPPPEVTRERTFTYHGQIQSSDGTRRFYRLIDGEMEVVEDPTAGMNSWSFGDATSKALSLIDPDGEKVIFPLNQEKTFVEPIDSEG